MSSSSSSEQVTCQEERRRCWICFDEESKDDEKDSNNVWVKPCKCSLTSHEQCLLDWIAENQKTSARRMATAATAGITAIAQQQQQQQQQRQTKVSCPQCATPYVIADHTSQTLIVLTALDRLIHAAAPYITLLGLGCSALVTSTTFGAYTVMNFLGPEQSEQLMGVPAQWTWRVWLSLPMIPVILISSRYRWADGFLPFATLLLLRAMGSPLHQTKFSWPPSPLATLGLFPWMRLIYNNLFLLVQFRLSRFILRFRSKRSQRHQQQEGAGGVRDRREFDILTRSSTNTGVSIIGALMWPLISSWIGSCLNQIKWVRHYFPEPFQRNTLGGCLYVIIKDFTSLVYRCEKIRQRRSRRVRNHNEIP
ncbi:hypothetical protein BDA99DRAFT_526577 [Phascolomyces articulosus]|uniref:RING-CH-type domain-containing protein n=1 Tax=Phascolomyces articulosus TaxID=60185 RepID=A0AAD5JXW1_9FUNG|nr:hypothetical protein BDA99DRAFT_526577 [Phascolomyces articulosus]